MTKEVKTSAELPNELEAALKKMTRYQYSGSEDKDFGLTIFSQTLNTLWLGNSDQETKETQTCAMLTAMSGAKPQCELEGMLVAQMIALHSASMECFRRAMFSQPDFDVRQASLSQGNKLSRSYAVLLDTLDRHRGKGVSEQKVTVEHVHVYEGGQAIVGNVEKKKKD